MISFWTLVKWTHVTGAIIWLGGISFVVTVLRPALARLPEIHLRRHVLARVVERMRRVMNVVVVLQVLTGGYMAWNRIGGASLRFWEGSWGLVLLVKIILASVMIALYVVVPRLLLSSPASKTCDELQGPPLKQKLGHMLHMVLLVLGFTVVFLAKMLTT